jgi:hypothetical protein
MGTAQKWVMLPPCGSTPSSFVKLIVRRHRPDTCKVAADVSFMAGGVNETSTHTKTEHTIGAVNLGDTFASTCKRRSHVAQ